MPTAVPSDVEIERIVRVRACSICGAQRTGPSSRGWPRTALVCPWCSDIAWLAIALGAEHLSPLRDPVQPRRPPQRARRKERTS